MRALSGREKILLALIILGVIFFLYWHFLLNPLLGSIGKTRSGISLLKLQLEQAAFPGVAGQLKGEEIKIFPKEEQLNRILKFIDYKFRWFGIKLASLHQSAENKKLIIDLKFRATSHQILGFLNSLPQLKTVLIIDHASMNQEGDRLAVEMKLLSAYK